MQIRDVVFMDLGGNEFKLVTLPNAEAQLLGRRIIGDPFGRRAWDVSAFIATRVEDSYFYMSLRPCAAGSGSGNLFVGLAFAASPLWIEQWSLVNPLAFTDGLCNAAALWALRPGLARGNSVWFGECGRVVVGHNYPAIIEVGSSGYGWKRNIDIGFHRMLIGNIYRVFLCWNGRYHYEIG